MEFHAKQIAPPNEWERFESLCLSLFKEIWGDPLAQKNGRRGQPQCGVDIFGCPGEKRDAFQGVQCKGKNQGYGAAPTEQELRDEIGKADKFTPSLTHWVFATTAPRDAGLQEVARKISLTRKSKGLFSVSVVSWDDIQELLSHSAPRALKEFYPEHVHDLDALVDKLDKLPSHNEIAELLAELHGNQATTSVSEANASRSWEPIKFDAQRDIAPALMGRALGPADAAACPRLKEVGATIKALETAYFVRLVGEPGAGKSLCVYQVAMHLVRQGWTAFRLSDAMPSGQFPNIPTDGQKILLVIDDAHLMPQHELAALEQKATHNCYVLTAHTAVEHADTNRGAIYIDAKRAVSTIAAALRADAGETLRVVRAVDDRVGETMMHTDIVERIEQSARESDRPWQFCFVLGGGWRRAEQTAANARANGAELILSAIALRQLASRDAPATREDIADLLEAASVDTKNLNTKLDWLEHNQVVLGQGDYRCPHQRYAEALLHQIFLGQSDKGRPVLGRLCSELLKSPDAPIGGLGLLLRSLRFGPSHSGSWSKHIDTEALSTFVSRCWGSSAGEERAYACLAIEAAQAYLPDWAGTIYRESERLAEWISSPARAEFGLGWLMNAVGNNDQALARNVVSQADADRVAQAISEVSPDDTYAVAELMQGIGCAQAKEWNAKVVNALDREALKALGREWPRNKSLLPFANFCERMNWFDTELALELTEALMPAMQERVAVQPIEALQELSAITSHVLRVEDPLGVYVGKHAPTQREKLLAKEICARIDADIVAEHVSQTRLRDMQAAATLLDFLHSCAPRKCSVIVERIDWDRIANSIGEYWSNLPHEAEVLIGVAFACAGDKTSILGFIRSNADGIDNFPLRLALVAPDVAIDHVASGRQMRFAKFDHFEWRYAPYCVMLFAERRPELLNEALGESSEVCANNLSGQNASWFGNAAATIEMLRRHAPEFLDTVLSKIKADKARLGWTDSLRKRGSCRQAVALLVEASLSRNDRLGDVARGLRKQFPSASIPANTVALPR